MGERVDRLARGALPRQSGDRVVRDQVDLARERSRQLGQTPRVLGAIVDSGQQGVLERHPSPGALAVIPRRRNHLGDRPTLVDRHQAIAQLVARGMERQGEPGLKTFLGQASDARDHAAGRDRDAPRAEIEAAWVVKDADGRDDRVVVGERLAHSHEHQIEAGILPRVEVPHAEDLGDDLVGSQIALEPHQSRGAEGAAQGAPDLAGEAEGHPPLGAHRDALDARAVSEREHELVRQMIAARVGGRDLRQLEIVELGHAFPERSRKVPHIPGRAQVFLVDPGEDLIRPITWISLVGQRGLQRGPRQAVETRPKRRGRAGGQGHEHGDPTWRKSGRSKLAAAPFAVNAARWYAAP